MSEKQWKRDTIIEFKQKIRSVSRIAIVNSYAQLRAECSALMSSAFLFASLVAVAVVAELCLPHYFYNIAQYENSINSPYFGGCASHFNRAISCQVPGTGPKVVLSACGATVEWQGRGKWEVEDGESGVNWMASVGTRELPCAWACCLDLSSPRLFCSVLSWPGLAWSLCGALIGFT